MSEKLSDLYCSICGFLLFRANLTSGTIEIICPQCHNIVIWSISHTSNVGSLKYLIQENKQADSTLLILDVLNELNLWRRLAFRRFKRSETLIFPFECKYIPEQVAKIIQEKLAQSQNELDIKSAFNILHYL